MRFTLAELATLLDGEIIGDSQVEIIDVAKIEDARKGSIAFLSNLKYESHLYSTKASAVLVDASFEIKQEVKTNLLKVQDAYSAFTVILEEVERTTQLKKTGVEQPVYFGEDTSVGKNVYIGAFSYIGKGAVIGENVTIHPQVHIGENVKIGDNTIIYPGVKVYEGCKVGKSVTVHSNTVIGSEGFGFAPQKDGSYKRIPQVGNVEISDYASIGGNCAIDCATMGSTKIGKGVKVDNLVQIAHNVEIGENSVIVSQVGIAGSTKIGKNCVLAGQVGVIGHLNIADKTTILAQSGVSRDTNEGDMILGSPAIERGAAIRNMTMVRSLPKYLKRIEALENKILKSTLDS